MEQVASFGSPKDLGQTCYEALDRPVDLEFRETGSDVIGESKDDNGTSSGRVSLASSLQSEGGVAIHDPMVLIRSLLGCGMSPDVAGTYATSYYNALRDAKPAVVQSSTPVSCASTENSRTLRTRKWVEERSSEPYVPGQCYLHAVRWGRRPAYLRALKNTPTFQSFLAMLEPGDLNIEVAKAVGFYRIRSELSTFSRPVYHVAYQCDQGDYLGSFYDSIACALRLYPSINSVYQCDTPGIDSLPLVGVVGVLPSDVVIYGSEVTVVRAPLNERSLSGVRDSDLSTPGGFNASDLSISDVTASDSQVSVSSGSSGGTIRVSHQELSFGRLDGMIRQHLRSSTDSQVLVVPQVLSSVPLVHPDSYIIPPSRAEISIMTVRGDVQVAAAGYRFRLDPTVLLVLPRGVQLEVLRGKSAEIAIQDVVAQVSIWWQRLYRPKDEFSNLLLPSGYNGVLLIGSFDYGWYDCASAAASGESVALIPLRLKEVPGRDFTVAGMTIKSPTTGRFRLDVRGGAVSVGGVILCAGQSYCAIGMQAQSATIVDAVGHHSVVTVSAPLMSGLDVQVTYILKNV